MDLHAAAAKGDVPEIDAALAAGADVNAPEAVDEAGARKARRIFSEGGVTGVTGVARERTRRTALMLAAAGGHARAVSRLLAAGADVGARDLVGQTALMFAAAGGHAAVVAALLKAGADANATNKGGTPVLAYGLLGGEARVVEALLAGGANPNATGEDRGESILSLAGRADGAVLAALLRAGWKADMTELLSLVLRFGRADAVGVLLGAGADANGRDDKGVPILCTAVDAAARRGVDVGLEALLAAGADVRAADRYRPLLSAPLLSAPLLRQDFALAGRLVALGADVNAAAGDGETFLMQNAKWTGGGVEAVEWLLAHGADPARADAQGRTALTVAEGREGARGVGELLRRAMGLPAAAEVADDPEESGGGSETGGEGDSGPTRPAAPAVPFAERRGLRMEPSGNSWRAVLVRAPIDAVAGALQSHRRVTSVQAGVVPVNLLVKSTPALVAVAAAGHDWVWLVGTELEASFLSDLSKALGTRALHVAYNDTADAVFLHAYENGERVERFEPTEEAFSAGADEETRRDAFESATRGLDFGAFDSGQAALDFLVRADGAYVPHFWLEPNGPVVTLAAGDPDAVGNVARADLVLLKKASKKKAR